MKLVAAVKGDLNEIVEKKNQQVLKAVSRAVTKTSNELKKEMISQTQSARLGYGLAKSWRVKFYNKNSSDKFPKGLVYTKSPHIMEGFESGGIRTPKKGKWLAIPTNNVPKSYKKRYSPANWPKSFPELYVAEDGSGKAYLVGQTIYNNGKIRKTNSKNESSADTVIYFFLVKQTKHTKKLNFELAKKKHQQKLKLYIKSELAND